MSPGLEEGSSPSALGGTRSQEILETLKAKQNKHTRTPTGVREGVPEHKEGITSFVSLSQRGFGENTETWKRHDLGLAQLVLDG